MLPTKHVNKARLDQLARQINDRERLIEDKKEKLIRDAGGIVLEAKLQGQDLIAAKAELPHGFFMDWVESRCPKSHAMANLYMRIAANYERVSNLKDADSIRAALLLCQENDREPGEVMPPRRWPPFLEAIGRFGKFADFIERNPVTGWPEEGRKKLRDQLLPIAEVLWPERF